MLSKFHDQAFLLDFVSNTVALKEARPNRCSSSTIHSTWIFKYKVALHVSSCGVGASDIRWYALQYFNADYTQRQVFCLHQKLVLQFAYIVGESSIYVHLQGATVTEWV
jgi:hypothetical protein